MKETFEMTKNVKRDFDNCMHLNETMKNELTNKMKRAENREEKLDLFLAERDDNSKKMI